MNYSPSLKILFVIFSSIVFCYSCDKSPIEKEDYRIKYVGNYLCVGHARDFEEGAGLDSTYRDTITLVVKIDNSSIDRIYVNVDLVQIDTSGYSYSAGGYS